MSCMQAMPACLFAVLFLGQQNDNPGRFRDNQGPRQPTYDQPISGAQSNVNEGVIQAEQVCAMKFLIESRVFFNQILLQPAGFL